MSKLFSILALIALAVSLAWSQKGSNNASGGKGKGKKINVIDSGGYLGVDSGNPLANRLLLLLTFAECAGASVRNLAPGYNGTNDGVIAGSPPWVRTPYGCAVSFSGSDDAQKITFPLAPWPALNDIRTTAVLFRMNANLGDLNIFLSYGVSLDAGTFWTMAYNKTAGRLYLYLRDVDKSIPWTFDTQWHLLHTVYPDISGNTAVKMYLDGVEVSSTAFGDRTLATVFINPGTAGELMLGRWGLGTGSNCHCDIGGVWMWSRGITAQEAQMHSQEPFGMLTTATRIIYVPDTAVSSTAKPIVNNPIIIK